MLRNFILLIYLFTSVSVFAQTEVDVEREFIYEGRHYKPHMPYYIIGTGYGFNFDEKEYEPNLFVDVHFRILEKHYLGTGFLLSRDKILAHGYDNIFYTNDYLKNTVTNLHVMYGWRKVGFKTNMAFFVGPSVNWGFDYVFTDTLGNYGVRPFLEPGIYANAQITYKYFFDLGVGLSAWTSLNKHYQVAGLSLHLYFSAALKRTLVGY